MALVSANPMAFYQMGAGLGDAFGSIADAQRQREASELAAQALDTWYGSDPSQGVPMSRLGEMPTGTTGAGVSTTPTGTDATGGPATTQGGTFQPFMSTVAQGIQNPYGLAAVAATGLHESRFSPSNANRTWSDPSQSGQPGTAGGILSWRGDRLQNLYRFAAQRGEQPGNISPQTQAAFFLQENPQLVNQLNSANSLEQAQALMNNAWRFAGYNQPGGEAAARVSSARNYLPEMTNDAVWRGMPQGANPQDFAQQPVRSPLPPGTDTSGMVQNLSSGAAPTRVASLDPSAGFSSLPPNLAAARGQNTPSGAPRTQVAQAQGMPVGAGVGTGAMPPSSSGNISPSVMAARAQASPSGATRNQVAAVRKLLSNPETRQYGMEMWRSMARPQESQFAFIEVNGQLVRVNKADGTFEPIMTGRQPLMNVGEGRLYDPNTSQWITAPNAATQKPPTVQEFYDQNGQPYKAQYNTSTGAWDRVGGTKAAAPRPLPQNTVNALGEAGSSYSDMNRISGGFKDEYGGQPLGLGEARNWAGRTFNSGATPQAEWWQDYQSKKNVTRNKLFGSALTATEAGEFEKADINPGMSPEAIRTNLARQQSAALRAARKLADTYTRMGYPPEQIEAAIGVPLDELRTAVDPLEAQQRPAGGASGGARDGATATNPKTGERVIRQNGKWVPVQ